MFCDHVRLHQARAFLLARMYVVAAGSLEELEIEVDKNPFILKEKIKLNHHIGDEFYKFEGTLEQLAIINLDYEMAAKLKSLRKNLPEVVSNELEIEAKQALSFTDEETIKKRELPVLRKAFDEIKKNNPDEAREIIKVYKARKKPKEMTDNAFFLEMLLFNYNAVKFLQENIGELSKEQIDQYYMNVIAEIQKSLPACLRKILEQGAYEYDQTKKFNREIEVRDSKELGKLGVDYFYSDLGRQNATQQPLIGGMDLNFLSLDQTMVFNFQKLYNVNVPSQECKP